MKFYLGPKTDNNFAAVEGNRIIDMKLLQDALTDAHVCPEGILYTREKEAEINKLATFAAVEAGLGREGLSDIMSILNISSPVSVSNYASHISKLLRTSKSAFDDQMSNAVQRL